MARRYLVAGNWKMHGLAADLVEVAIIAERAGAYSHVEVALCLPATLIERAVRAVPDFRIGGQDVHGEPKGAHTGDISAAMLADAGAKLTIVGHSERRTDHGESDASVRAKAAAALSAGLGVILCCGESLEVRGRGDAIDCVDNQLDASLPDFAGEPARLSVAYEPIWAIGTGLVPSLQDIAAMHGALRKRLVERYGDKGVEMRILYGGSVKGSNAVEILAIENVDGALVGGASLKSADFLTIVDAAGQS